MSFKRFLRELLTAIVLGSVLFFGFLGYYYFTDIPRFDLIVGGLRREYTDNILFFIVMYLFNMGWIFYMLKKWDNHIYTLGRITTLILGNLVLSVIGVFVGVSCKLRGYY